MIAHKLEVTVGQNGSITLTNLPFASGEAIEVILMTKPGHRKISKRSELKGTLVKYSDPLEPVAVEDWDALS